jgi:small-conductance mechanosensitive channel
MLKEIIAILKRPFEQIALKDVFWLSGGLVLVALAGVFTYRVLQVLEGFLEGRKKPSRAILFRLIRVPAVLTVLTVCLIVFGERWGWEELIPRIHDVSRFFLWLSISWGVIRFLEYAFLQRLLYEQHGVRMPKLFHDVIVLSLYAIVIVSLLRIFFDVNLTVLLTTSAVFSLILGLALQDTLSNLFAGLALHFEGTLHLGQWVGIGEWEGEIAGITWRSIKIRTFEGDYVIVPNSTIAKSELTNYSQPTPMHAQRLTIGVGYDFPPGEVKRAVLTC